jgi:flagellar motor switch protein FliG
MIRERKFTGPQKAAVLMMTLGEEKAAEMFEKLDEEEVEVVSAYMASIGMVTPEEVQSVLSEFSDLMDGNQVPTLAGREAVRKFLIKTLGEKKASNILKEMHLGESLRGKKGTLLSVQAMDSGTVATLVAGEHPQVIALVIAHLEPERAGEVLNNLPPPVQMEVIQRISNLDRISPEMLDDLDDVLHEKMKGAGGGRVQKVGGVQSVVDMLNNVDRSLQSNILKEMETVNENLAEEIQALLFTFEDLILLDDRSMQVLLKEVKNDVLVTALKSVSPELEEGIYRNMSERQAAMIREDLDALGGVKLRDVERCQADIVREAKRMEEEGRITIGGRGEGDVIV